MNKRQKKSIKFLIVLIAIFYSTNGCLINRNSATIPVQKYDEYWIERHERTIKLSKTCNYNTILIGDSITQGWEKRGKKVWENYFPDLNVLNLGISADRTEHVLWRLVNGYKPLCSPSTAIVLIGTNNQKINRAAEIAAGVKSIVRKIQEYHPEIKIILISILPCGKEPNVFRDRIAKVNGIISKMHDGEKIYYLDIYNSFLNKDGLISEKLMYDYLHPTAEGYEIIAGNIRLLLEGFK